MFCTNDSDVKADEACASTAAISGPANSTMSKPAQEYDVNNGTAREITERWRQRNRTQHGRNALPQVVAPFWLERNNARIQPISKHINRERCEETADCIQVERGKATTKSARTADHTMEIHAGNFPALQAQQRNLVKFKQLKRQQPRRRCVRTQLKAAREEKRALPSEHAPCKHAIQRQASEQQQLT